MKIFDFEPIEPQSDLLVMDSLRGHPFADRQRAVMWYGAIHQNKNDRSQPLATVLFHDVNDGRFYGEFRCRKVSALNLGLLPIGSVWYEGRMVSQARFMTKQFKVDFSHRGWEYYTLNGDKEPLVPPNVYPLFYPCKNDLAGSWMLKFFLGNDQILLIPSLVFFTRCYGSSALRRHFLTLPWAEIENRLFSKSEELNGEEANNNWAIFLPSTAHKSDVHILAHIKYDNYAALQVKHIAAQALSSDENNRIFLKVAPWLSQKGKISVSGFYIRETKTFLALNILGIGPDRYPPYLVYKYHTKTTNLPEDEFSYPSSSTQTPNDEYSDPELLDNKSPSINSRLKKFSEPDFEWINEPIIKSKKLARERLSRKNNSKSEDKKLTNLETPTSDDTFSTSEAYGSSGNTTEALTHSKQPTESIDKLWSLWKAINDIAKKNKEHITAVYHYDITNGFCNSGIPRLINFPLKRENNNTEKNNNTKEQHNRTLPRRFPLTYGNPEKRRGLLLIKLSLANTDIYVIDIQHRTDVSGESFAGLAFTLTSTENLDDFLRLLIDSIIANNGHVRSIAKNWRNGKAFAYYHVDSPGKKVTMPENTVRIILVKMMKFLGINLPLKFRNN